MYEIKSRTKVSVWSSLGVILPRDEFLVQRYRGFETHFDFRNKQMVSIETDPCKEKIENQFLLEL